MKKRAVWVAAMMSLSLSGMAQQVLPKDVAGIRNMPVSAKNMN